VATVALAATHAACDARLEAPTSSSDPRGARAPSRPGEPGAPGAPRPDPDAACELGPLDPAPSVIARLTRTEYIRTVEAHFDLDVEARAADLPFEIRAPFTTTAIAQATGVEHAEVFSEVAAAAAASLGEDITLGIACDDFRTECVESWIRRWGERLFRRPLRPGEVDGFRPVFALVQSEGEGFVVAADLALRAMLQSPQFLYHLEDRRGERVRPLDPLELANRIAYLVWRAPPDPELARAATEGQLAEPSAIEAQVRRMARDPKARTAARIFIEDWVDLGRLERAVRILSDRQKADFREETERFVDHVLWTEDGGLVDLLGADYTFLNERLADQYDLNDAPTDWALRDLSAEPKRRGILTQGSLLSAHANGNRPRMVSRGLFILRSILCRDVPDPVAGVDTTITDLPDSAGELARSEERLERGACGPCHAAFDPLAYAFDGFDGAGRFSSTDDYGNAVAVEGWVPPETGASEDRPEGRRYAYDDVEGLIDILIQAPFVRRCLTEKPLGFALRRALGSGAPDDCAVRAIAEDAEAKGGSYVDLLVAMATHRYFTHIAPGGIQ